MFSKPLLKQSIKSNLGIWLFVTIVTCFMLAIVILVLGNLNVGGIRDSMTDMFVEDAIESVVQNQSMTYYNLTDTSLKNFDNSVNGLNYLLNTQMTSEQKAGIVAQYNALKTAGKSHDEAVAMMTATATDEQKVAITTLLNYYVVEGENYDLTHIREYVLVNIQNALYVQFLETEGEIVANSAKAFISSAISAYLESGITDTEIFATNYIPVVLRDVFYAQEFEYQGDTIGVRDYMTKEKIENVSLSAILTYKAQLNSYIQKNPTATEEEIATKKQEIIGDNSKSMIEELPTEVSDALMEISGLDIYSLVVGSIFFRVAGLLLPIIYIIMASNNLISSQVDSGSMAYILSTPTKRRKVTRTQMLYLISSLFVMFALTTITSVVCLSLIDTTSLSISYSHMILFNVGAFITTFAISGICFLASSWFNRSKMAMAVGGGISMFFLVATILGLFGSPIMPSAVRIDAMNYFNYVSLITLFDSVSIMNNTTAFIWKWAILLVVGIVTYLISIIKFDKKDLPL